ncbi:MAG: multicopper oxidase domain-containing protein, partial [Gallionella sp.]
MQKMQSRKFKHNPVAIAVALTLAAPLAINQAHASAGWGYNANGIDIMQTYYSNSPSGLRNAASCYDFNGNPATPVLGGLCDSGKALRKFVDTLAGFPGVSANGAPNTLGEYIPLAFGSPLEPDSEMWITTEGVKTGDYYFELAVVEYFQKMHSDLPKATRLRGYVQIETPYINNLRLTTRPEISKHIPLTYPNGTPILDVNGVQVYGVDKPHYLGPLILALKDAPVRFKFQNYLPYGNMTEPGTLRVGGELFIPVDHTQQQAGVGPDGITPYTDNRVAIHLHGGDAPWLADGNAHQWFVPAGETAAYAAGMGKGASTANVPDMPDPGPGAYHMYYPNAMSARLMWYHDHASGITKLNAYTGMAAGYLLVDGIELNMMGVIPTPGPMLNTLPALADTIPLIIQEKGFVPRDIMQQDGRWDETHWGSYGDLWFPHVYETNQDPNSVDATNPVGRWDWGPWFWPVFPAQYSIPTGVYGDVTQTPEAFLDTPVINGTVYPTVTVEPKPYRLMWLNGSNDRCFNLGFYVADTTSPQALAVQADTGVLGTEMSMVPFEQGAGGLPTVTTFPMTGGLNGTGWGVPSGADHLAGVPDPASIGPDIIQFGTEGGYLPEVVVIPSTPMNFDYNRRSATGLSILERGLFLCGAMRADTVVDFTNFAGKVLILYNDAPAPAPAFDPRIDYYTGAPDFTGVGGSDTTPPGYGPNTRTLMRIEVLPALTGAPSNWRGLASLISALPAAYSASGQEAPFVPQAAYNSAFGTTNTNNYIKINAGSALQNTVFFAPTGAQTITGVAMADGGSGYTTMPTVVFTPPPGSTGSGASAVVGTSIGGIIVGDPGAGYVTPPTVVFSGGTKPDGTAVDWALTPNYATATAVLNPLTGGIKSVAVAAPVRDPQTGLVSTNNFKTMPTVTFAGGGATRQGTATAKSSGKLVSITLTNPGTGYTATPFVTFTGSRGNGAAANVTTNLTTVLPVRNKGIQELFDPIYGRMTATYSVELPLTTALTATTVPVAYIDPTTEFIKDNETQIWKITHNGVDTHPVHIHMVNVQIINRVGWDGSMRPPYANELGWRETIQMNPLEDIYLAVRPKREVLPGFGLPESVHLMDPSQPEGSALGFSPFDLTGSPMPQGDGIPGSPTYIPFNPNFGMPTAVPVVNAYENFDNEYTWHCHILGHEEFDFMRPLVYHPFDLDWIAGSPTFGQWVIPGTNILAVPVAPANVTATIVPTGVQVSWTDSSYSEFQFRIERAPESAPGSGVPGVFAPVFTALANATRYLDTTAVAGTPYFYRVAAVGAKGESLSAVAGLVVAAPAAAPVASLLS